MVPGIGYFFMIPIFYFIKAFKYGTLVDIVRREWKKNQTKVQIQKGSFALPENLVKGPTRYSLVWFIQVVLRFGILIFIDWAFSNIVP